jgi:nitronate monooxygenase
VRRAREVTLLLDECRLPVVLAPLAGGPSTPELCAAVSEAGGLGFLAAGYLAAAEVAARIDRTRELTARPFGVNLFVPTMGGDPAAVEAYARHLEPEARKAGVRLGEPRDDDDDWEAKLDVLTASPVPLVSFTFGCPPTDVFARLQRLGSEVWVTVTSLEEAHLALSGGADGLVVQGLEAGGHRGGFTDTDEGTGLLALLQLIGSAVSLPLIAAGGIMTGAGLAAALTAGARAGAMGTAFLLCPEAGTSLVHRNAMEQPHATALTRAFTGRLARGMRNRFLDEHSEDAPSAYPQVHHLTAPLRAHGRSVGDGDLVNLWAGQAYPLAVAQPAGEVVRRVAEEARAALDRARRVLD